MYEEVATQPDGDFHFFTGREAAELFGYDPEWLDQAPAEGRPVVRGRGQPPSEEQPSGR